MPAPTRSLSLADVRRFVDEEVFASREGPPTGGRVGIELEWIVVPRTSRRASRRPRHAGHAAPHGAPGREPDHLRARRPARAQRSGGAVAARSPARRCAPTPRRCGRALGPHDLELVGAGIDTRGDVPACTRRTALPGDGGVLRHSVALRTHDDAQHRVDPGEPRRREPSDRRCPLAPGARPRARCSPRASPTRRSTRRVRPPVSGRRDRRCGTRSIRRAPAPARNGRRSDASTDVDALSARCAGDDDPRRRTRQPGARRADDVRRVGDRRSRRRMADRRRPRVPRDHAVPTGAPARMARAPHDRRAPRGVVAGCGRASPPRCSTIRSPPRRGRRRHGAARATVGTRPRVPRCTIRRWRAPRSSASPPPGPALERLGADDATRAATDEYFDRFVARGRCPADEQLDDWSRLQAAGV